MTAIRKPAAAAAAFALSSMAAFAAEPPAGSTGRALGAEDTVHCYGVHSCKGQADCATTENARNGSTNLFDSWLAVALHSYVS